MADMAAFSTVASDEVSLAAGFISPMLTVAITAAAVKDAIRRATRPASGTGTITGATPPARLIEPAESTHASSRAGRP
jgi:hypothetical protein